MTDEKSKLKRHREVIPPRLTDGPTCRLCGEHLRYKEPDVCGFCREVRKRVRRRSKP